jgi:hypothetical protein
MPFEKGRAKTGGRKKGTPNNTTKLIKEHLLAETCDYVNSGLFHTDLTTIPDPVDRLNFFAKIINYLLPKQQAVSTSIDVADAAQQSVLEQLKQLAKDNDQ